METKKKAIKPMYVLIAAVLVILILGVVYSTSNNSPVVASGDNISVYYKLTLANGTVFQSNFGGQPLNFTVGSGQMIRGFDQGVIGMRLDQNKTITIPADQAYGPINPALLVKVPRSAFGNHSVYVGMVIQNSNGQQGTITALNSTNATVDFNSPLAGQNLTFTIMVIRIKGG